MHDIKLNAKHSLGHRNTAADNTRFNKFKKNYKANKRSYPGFNFPLVTVTLGTFLISMVDLRFTLKNARKLEKQERKKK